MLRIVAALLLSAVGLSASSPCSSSDDERHGLADYHRAYSRATLAERRSRIDALAVKYPDSLAIGKARIQLYKWYLPDAWPALRGEYLRQAERRPRDPLALTFAGLALYQFDTPRAIKMLEQALQVSPGYPWAALELAEIYSYAKFQDNSKAQANFSIFVNSCGDDLPAFSMQVLGKATTKEMEADVARRLRTRLEHETDPSRLLDYELLWNVEFHARPPQNYGEVRQQVAKDVARLEKMNPKPDERWMSLLLTGVKQSGASKEELLAMENRVIATVPNSLAAYQIVSDRWDKKNEKPADQKDTAAWKRWNDSYLAAMKDWMVRFSDLDFLKAFYLSAAIDAGKLSEAEAVRGLEEDFNRRFWKSPDPRSFEYLQNARILLDHHWAPSKALDWARRGWQLAHVEVKRELEDDTLTESRRKELSSRSYDSQADLYLHALQAAEVKEVPPDLRALVEGPMPEKKSQVSWRYWMKARLARIDGKRADALAYYQQALFTRTTLPQYWRGKLQDSLMDEAKSLYTSLGGSAEAFALWAKAPNTRPAELAEARWEKPTRTLPDFELSDFTGKTWKLRQLEGKVVLITVWATWCGPCLQELPLFQKLYEKVKDRPDVQVLSFNVDDELGVVEPFLKEQRYTFPVLQANTFVSSLFDGYGIPQNWLVDPKGKWLATQMGFSPTETDWVGMMTKCLEDARSGKAPAGVSE